MDVVRVLLRHNRTGHYYRGNFEWAVPETDATDFGSIEHALEVIASDTLDGMSLVIRYDASGCEQVFDLSEDSRTPLPSSFIKQKSNQRFGA